MDERTQLLEMIAKERLELARLRYIDAPKQFKVACFSRLTELYNALNILHMKNKAAA